MERKSFTLSFVAVCLGILILSFAAENFAHAFGEYMDAQTVVRALKDGVY